MQQIKVGIVISDKMNKSAVVKVTYKVKHPFYKKIITRSKNFKAGNEIGAKTGQTVKLSETKPISKSIHYQITEVLN